MKFAIGIFPSNENGKLRIKIYFVKLFSNISDEKKTRIL